MSRSRWTRRLVVFAMSATWGIGGGVGAGETDVAAIDGLMEKAAGARGVRTAGEAEEHEFLRRAYLDFAGRIPSVRESRAFEADREPAKRERLVERLTEGSEYPRRMAEAMNVMLMERMGDDPRWSEYLLDAFRRDVGWDRIVADLLTNSRREGVAKGSAFFIAKRLEKYGENPVDYPGLTRDVGRLFLGVDLQCAQCHDHLFYDDYKQSDFQGLFAFFHNATTSDAKSLVIDVKPLTSKVAYSSVFKKVPKATGPKIPGLPELEIPEYPKGEEYLEKPDRKTRAPGVLKFSPLTKLAEALPTSRNPAFARNMANRLWFLLLGRGLVHPLDLHHSENPPSHPEVLELLAERFKSSGFRVKGLLREIAKTKTYARSSIVPEGVADANPAAFAAAIERPLSAEQLARSFAQALSNGEPVSDAQVKPIREAFVKAFANAPRDPEESFSPTLRAALFLRNESTIVKLLRTAPGNLLDRLEKLDAADAICDELYLAVLARPPDAEERAEVAEFLGRHKGDRAGAARSLVWALLSSTEFRLNH